MALLFTLWPNPSKVISSFHHGFSNKGLPLLSKTSTHSLPQVLWGEPDSGPRLAPPGRSLSHPPQLCFSGATVSDIIPGALKAHPLVTATTLNANSDKSRNKIFSGFLNILKQSESEPSFPDQSQPFTVGWGVSPGYCPY